MLTLNHSFTGKGEEGGLGLFYRHRLLEPRKGLSVPEHSDALDLNKAGVLFARKEGGLPVRRLGRQSVCGFSHRR